MALSPKERAFVAAYVRLQNGTEAAIEAGYAKSGAKQESCRLLKRPAVAAAVEEAQKRLDEKAERGALEVIAKLWQHADYDERDADQLKALELLGKTFGIFVEKHEHSGPGGAPIVFKAATFPDPLAEVAQ